MDRLLSDDGRRNVRGVCRSKSRGIQRSILAGELGQGVSMSQELDRYYTVGAVLYLLWLGEHWGIALKQLADAS